MWAAWKQGPAISAPAVPFLWVTSRNLGKKKKKGSKCYTHLPAFSFCRQGILARTKSSKDQNKLMKKKTIPCDKLEEATTVNSFHLIVMSSDEKNSRGNREVNRKSDASGLLLISRLILQSLARSLHLQCAPKVRMLQYGKPTPVPCNASY